MDYKQIAGEILHHAGGKENVDSISCCMTRLRLRLHTEQANRPAIKSIEGVHGIIGQGKDLQIVLGPGMSGKVSEEFSKLVNKPLGSASIAFSLKEELQEKNQTVTKILVRRLANVFIPLIPAFIGCGLIMAVNNILIKFLPGWSATPYAALFGILGGAVVFGLSIFVGVNTAREFSGSPMIGGVMAVILTSPALSGISLFGIDLVPGRGGVIAVLFVVIFSSWLERKIRARMPDTLELFLTPTLTILIAGVTAVLFLQPLGGIISSSIVKGVTLAITHGGALSGFLLSCFFLPLVMTGLHQGLTPIHAQLIDAYGYTVLFPILAMAGAGQVGAAFAVFFKTKNKKFKKTILSALPVGILGVGEPLIFGVTLPLVKPFIAACIGGGIGGAFVAHFQVGAYVIGGISGIPLTPLTTAPWVYLAGIAIAYVGGFVCAWFMGFEDPDI